MRHPRDKNLPHFYGRQPWFFAALALLLSCMVPLETDDPEDAFQFEIAGATPDTVSPFGPLVLRFTRQVKDPDSVSFVFSPLFSEYQIRWNGSHDTARLFFTIPLAGNSGYTIKQGDRITSTEGSVIARDAEPVAFATWPSEEEPNGSKDLADLLTGTLFGQVYTVNDTDVYRAADTAKRSFYLKSTGSVSAWIVRDSRDSLVVSAAGAVADTLNVPSDFVPPFYLSVFARNFSSGGSYELGWVKKP